VTVEMTREERLERDLRGLRRAVGAYVAQHKVDRCGCLVCDTTREIMAQVDETLKLPPSPGGGRGSK
jgi:hypothetical protein